MSLSLSTKTTDEVAVGPEWSAADTGELEAGRLLAGRYRLDGLIRTGGTAQVHRGWDTLLRRAVAVKLVAPGAGRAAYRRFDNEMHVLAALGHPNVVSVYDVGGRGRDSFVVLQLVDGPTLRDHLDRGPFSEAQTRLLGVLLSDALAHVHEHGVAHRDLTPTGVLFDHAGKPHLADFGLAGPGGSRTRRTDRRVGTTAYLAPEQVRGDAVGEPADVYALGLVLLECLTGRPAFTGRTALSRLGRSPEIPLSAPSDLAHLLAAMTARRPKDRPTAAACGLALRGFAAPVPPPAAPSRHRVLVGAATAVTLAAIALAVGQTPDPTIAAPAAPTAIEAPRGL
ncbi:MULTISPECIES: serine/threonine-protein kinase [Actinosynnema]|uniref:serine/threonine-protein kinase n=1 Tax=Actinosynnema TaxID=40566 RepID=UPI0020A37818|nr:serine/threonine-protein kinase [Actinosynnema pretiosum]MCP2099095.1 Serine/threonine protein kinase [Actinosynnema pretiosum]